MPSMLWTPGLAISAGLLVRPPGAVHPRWDNLVAGWKLNEESDGSAPVGRADVLGNYGLTDFNTTPSSESGLYNRAANPSRANSEALYYQASGAPGLPWPPDSTDFVMVVWAKLDAIDVNQWALECYGSDGKGGFQIVFLSRTVQFAVKSRVPATKVVSDANAIPAEPVPTNWHMVIAWYDTSENKIWVQVDDRAPQSTAAATYERPSWNNSYFTVGHRSGNTIGGLMDEYYIFHGTIKDAAWRSEFYNGGAGRSYPN